MTEQLFSEIVQRLLIIIGYATVCYFAFRFLYFVLKRLMTTEGCERK